MLIQCKNIEQYDLLAMQLCTLPLDNLQVDIDPDLIPVEIQQEFTRLGEQDSESAVAACGAVA